MLIIFLVIVAYNECSSIWSCRISMYFSFVTAFLSVIAGLIHASVTFNCSILNQNIPYSIPTAILFFIFSPWLLLQSNFTFQEPSIYYVQNICFRLSSWYFWKWFPSWKTSFGRSPWLQSCFFCEAMVSCYFGCDNNVIIICGH